MFHLTINRSGSHEPSEPNPVSHLASRDLLEGRNDQWGALSRGTVTELDWLGWLVANATVQRKAKRSIVAATKLERETGREDELGKIEGEKQEGGVEG